ncbi:MAG: hypothetical protein DMG65_18590 [Candidatus Angelobacter sp. Gp1-AA117]|nr:MAG: hypothetical protein DMG65_18590 [Candidatus Angelobacter sp. Gp1-AA117]
MISSYRTVTAVLMIAFCAVLVLGCGDTFRPTINVEPTPTGDPSSLQQALVLATNPAGNGSTTHINVSGDTNVGVVTVGSNPVFLGKDAARAFVVNSFNGTANTVSLYLALLPSSPALTTVTLPTTSPTPSDIKPVAGGFGGTNGNIYIAESAINAVTLIITNNLVASGNIPVGTEPVAVAGNANNGKVYVVNHGSNNVSVISTVDNSVIGSPIAVGSQPIWAVMSDDGTQVFVINQGGNSVTVIDTATDTVSATITGFSSPNYAVYDSRFKRLYVSNTGNNTIGVIRSDVSPPAALPSPIAVSGTPTSVAVLSDGSRVYAALGNCPAGTNQLNFVATITNPGNCLGNTVAVIDSQALHQTKTITVGSGAVSVDASSDASKVYVVNAHDATASIIRTASDTELLNAQGQPARVHAPEQNLSCINPSSCPPSGTPQIPFMVKAFP